MENKSFKLLTPKDVQQMVGLSSLATVYNYMSSGLLPYRQIGAKRRFTLDDINKFLDNCKKSSKSSKPPS
ncbi:MAG: helix-turn-helix domain-containing protein [Candidatus Omnitrophota bacterium]